MINNNSITICCDPSPYNTYKSIRKMGYKVIQHLMLNNDEIWKLLKYDTPDALSKSDLTLKEKGDLIWDGRSESAKFRVFRGAYVDDMFNEQCSQLRIYITTLNPDNRTLGTADIGIEIITHVNLVNLDTYENRLEVMLQQVIETLNGREIDGVGRLFFDRTGSLYDIARLNLYNNRNFYGYTIIFSTKVIDTNGSIC